MDPVLFFYSPDGTATFGPVTEDALRLLFKDKVIGPGSFVCPEGESEWKPLDLEWLRRPQSQTTRLPRYEPPPYVPTDTAKEREEARAQQLEEVWDYGPVPAVFKWGSVAFAALATILLAALQADAQGMVVGLLAGLALMGLTPYLISLSFSRAWKARAWAGAVVILAALTFLGQASYNRVVRMAESIEIASPTVANPAPPPVAPKSDAATSLPPVDPAEVPRMVRAAQSVEKEMTDKVQASDDAEKACGNFDPATLASQDELHTLQGGVTKLRASQSDVLAYFNTYDDRIRTSLANGGFTAAGIEQFVASVHQSGHIDQAVGIWQLRIKLTDDHLARLDFLDKIWGKWQSKDGKLLFVNQSDLDNYNALTQDLATDIQKGRELQEQALAK